MSTTQPKQETGHFAWNELNTSNPSAAAEFYTKLFGWTTSELEMPGGKTYTMFMKEGTPVAGLVRWPDDAVDSPPLWQSYVNVADIDRSITMAKELGATVCCDRFDLPSGSFAVLNDPDGATIALWQQSEPCP